MIYVPCRGGVTCVVLNLFVILSCEWHAVVPRCRFRYLGCEAGFWWG